MIYKQGHYWTMLLLLITAIGLSWYITPTPALAQSPQAENEPCFTCHNNPDLKVEFADGSVLFGHVDRTIYQMSVHGQEGMTCGGCHPNHTTYPHPEVTVVSSRAYIMQRNETCVDCHPDQTERVEDSTHAQALAEGNIEAAVCVDCHGAHDTVSLHEARVKIATTCRKCHSSIYDDYNESIHGEALRVENNTDVPTCVDCHGVHNMEDPTTARFRLNSPNLCGSCHANEALMSKYDISTDVFETYVADFHGTTITLFEKQSPDAPTNKAVCYDCHGVHDIKAADDPEAAVIKENLLETCQKCHPDATANFPDSWASHYQPTLEEQPLVAIVNLFYLIFIPGTLGFMGVFVLTDAGRRLINRRKQTPPAAEAPSAVQADDSAEDQS